MKRFTLAVVALSGWVIGPACQSIVGIEDRSEAPPLEDASASDAASSDAPAAADARSDGPPDIDPDAAPPLGCPSGCLPPAPVGWTGPSATYDGADGTKPAACPAPYTVKELDAHQGMIAPAATCECGAATVTGRSCTAGVATYDTACVIGTGTKIGSVTSTTCFVTKSDMGSNYQVNTPTLIPGTCTFPNAKTTLTPPSFTKVDIACGLARQTACAGRADCTSAPTPDAPYGRLCIHKDGEVSCPSKDYGVRFVAYKKVDDTRACTACTATPTGGACQTKWNTRVKLADCGNALAPKSADMTAGGCYAYSGSGTIIDATGMTPTAATCTASGGAASGTASSVDPVTFCCNQ